MTMYFSKASNFVNSFKKFREILTNYTSTNDLEGKWDPVLMDSSKGSLIYRKVSAESTLEAAFDNAVWANVAGLPDSNYNKRFIQRLAEVTIEDVQVSARKYLNIFDDPAKTYTAIVCSPDEVTEISELVKKYGINLTTISDLEDSI